MGCGVCDMPELWRGAAGLCARGCACAGAAESVHTCIHTCRNVDRAIDCRVNPMFAPASEGRHSTQTAIGSLGLCE